jgi:hypothetical protein
VDLSNTYLDWGKVNFAMNRLETGFTFTRSDVIEFIMQAKQKAKLAGKTALNKTRCILFMLLLRMYSKTEFFSPLCPRPKDPFPCF